MTSTLEWALRYAARDWPIFQVWGINAQGHCDCRLADKCKSPGKHPVRTGWQDEATTDSAVIRRWWSSYANANIGAPTGSGGTNTIVIDIDAKKGGVDTWEAMLLEHGDVDTLIARTGGGGWHVHLDPEGMIYRGGTEIAEGIDLRAEGNLVVLPPSPHYTGGHYKWETSPKALKKLSAYPWLVELLEERDTKGAVSKELEPLPEKIQDGRRNELLAKMAGSLRARKADESQILAALRSLNEDRCEPSLADDEVQQIARSYAGYPEGYNGPPSEPDPEGKVDGERPQTDSGNAELLVEDHAHELRWDGLRGKWMIFRDHHWLEDDKELATKLALGIARKRRRIAAGLEDNDASQALFKWAMKSENRTGLKNMLEVARALMPTTEQWDRDNWLFGVENGVIDLRTGELRDAKPEDYITLHSPVAFDPEAKCPRWLQFLQEVFGSDESLIRFTQVAVGYTMTGDTREQVMFLLHGGGSNGKSVFLNVMTALFGSYAINLALGTLEASTKASGGQASPEIASLPGRRLVTASETTEGSVFHEGRVKALTGGDPLTARHLFKGLFTFKPVGKFWIGVNHLPRVVDDSEGFWRRMRLIPFGIQFKGANMDLTLESKMKAELPGILNWALEGCHIWQKEGLRPPERVMMATQAYRTSEDVIGSFLQDCCVLGEGVRVKASHLYNEYKAWAVEQGARERDIMKNTTFGRRMTERFDRGHKSDGWWYEGVALRARDDAGEATTAPAPEPEEGEQGQWWEE